MAFVPLDLDAIQRLGQVPSADIGAITDLCDPLRPLAYDAQDLLRVDLGPVRGGAIFDPVARQIERAKLNRRVHLVSGLPGSGKSTELLRLKARLEHADGDQARRRFRTVYIDALQFLSINDLDFSWVLLGVLSSLVDTFSDLATRSRHLGSVWADLRRVLDAAGVEADASIDTGLVKLGIKLKSDPHSRDLLRHRLPPRAEELIDQTNAFLDELRTRLATEGYDDVVIILDNLEKMVPRKVEGTARDTFETTFYDGAPLFQRLDAHLVVTVPPSLCYRDVQAATLPALYSGPPRMVPMVRIKEREGSEDHAPGLDKLREVLARRLDLDAVFEDAELVLDLCRLSGGSVRRLMNLVAEMSLAVDDLPLTREAFDGVRRKLAATADRALPSEYLGPLAEVARTHDFASSIVEGNKVKGACLQSQMAMEYNGDGHWYDVDPLLHTLPRFQAALAAWDADRAAGDETD